MRIKSSYIITLLYLPRYLLSIKKVPKPQPAAMEQPINEKRPRGRPPKAVEPALHRSVLQQRARDAPKLSRVMDVIKEEFIGGLRAFLNCWTVNNETSTSRGRFIRGGGAAEIVSLWLPLIVAECGIEGMPQELPAFVWQKCDAEVGRVVKGAHTILRNARGAEEGGVVEPTELMNVIPDMEAMQSLVQAEAPTVWRLCEAVAVGKGGKEKTGTQRKILSSVMILLNTRSQQINSFQTMMGMLLSACHLTKAGLEFMQGTGICCSYTHLLNTQKKFAQRAKEDLLCMVRRTAVKVDLDNINRKIGVRDGPGTREAVMDNSTGGFVSPVYGMPQGITQIPRDWADFTKRIHLRPRELGPSETGVSIIAQRRLNIMEEIVRRMVLGRKNEDDWKFPNPAVDVIYPEATEIFPLDLMPFEQSSTDGNLEAIKLVLGRDLLKTNQELMQSINLVCGDSMLVSRVRSVQLLREYDVPGEDFKYILPGLGPLHTLMNMMKLFMKLHLGPRDGSTIGSGYHMNKKLRRQGVDEEATNLWACLDFVKDATEACVLALQVEEGRCESFAEFCTKVRNGTLNYEAIVAKVNELLEYSYIGKLREEDDEKRDIIRENVLLFVRKGMEVRAFYKGIRGGDVGMMEYIMQVSRVVNVGIMATFRRGSATRLGNLTNKL